MRKLLAVLLLLSGLALAQNAPVTGQLTAQAATCNYSQSNTTACIFLPIGPAVGTVAATLSGTFSGTLQFEGSADSGSTWVSVAATPSSGGASATSATAAGTWQINSGGYTYIRIRCSTYSSGTVIATLNPSKAVSGTLGGGSSSSTPYSLGAINAIGASGASQTIVSTNGAVQSMTLSSATVIISFTQPSGNAALVRLKITQAAGGNDVISWTSVKWPGGVAPVMTAGANSVDWYSCMLDGANTYCTASQNFQ